MFSGDLVEVKAKAGGGIFLIPLGCAKSTMIRDVIMAKILP